MKLSLRLGVRRFLNSPFHYNDVEPNARDTTLKKETVYRHTAWEWSIFRHCWRRARRRFEDQLLHETVKAEDAPRLREYVARQRVKAASEELSMPIQSLIPALRQSRLGLDPQALAQLAIWEPRSFRAVVQLCKGLAEKKEIPLPPRDLPQCQDLGHLPQQEPFPRGKTYSKGPTENFYNAPRTLQPHEF